MTLRVLASVRSEDLYSMEVPERNKGRSLELPQQRKKKRKERERQGKYGATDVTPRSSLLQVAVVLALMVLSYACKQRFFSPSSLPPPSLLSVEEPQQAPLQSLRKIEAKRARAREATLQSLERLLVFLNSSDTSGSKQKRKRYGLKPVPVVDWVVERKKRESSKKAGGRGGGEEEIPGFAAWAAKGGVPVVAKNTLLGSLAGSAGASVGQRWSDPGYLQARASGGKVHKVYKRRGDSQFNYWHDRALRRLPELQDGATQLRASYDRVEDMEASDFFDFIGRGQEAVCAAREGRGSEMAEAEICSSSSLVSSSFYYYYTNPIEEDFAALLADLPDNFEEVLISSASSSSKVAATAETTAETATPASSTTISLWLGPELTVTPTHSDKDENVYWQVSGRKRFLLFPPSLHSYLYLYPSLHPRHQQSMVPLTLPLSLYSEEGEEGGAKDGQNEVVFGLSSPFPRFGAWGSDKELEEDEEERTGPLVVDLVPGDVLFIPPEWFHHVLALTPSVSLNAWSEPSEYSLFLSSFRKAHATLSSSCLTERANEEEQDMEREKRVRDYLTLLLAEFAKRCEGRRRGKKWDQSSAKKSTLQQSFVEMVLLQQRYIPWLEREAGSFSSLPPPTQAIYCSLYGKQAMGKGSYASGESGCVESARQAVHAFFHTAPSDEASRGIFCLSEQYAIAELRLAEHVENIVQWAVGPSFVAAFLLDFVRCPRV